MNRKAYLILLIFSLFFLSCGGGGGGGTNPASPPPAPQNVLSAGGNGQVYLSWGDVGGATSYNIYWSTAAGVDQLSGTKITVTAGPYYHAGLSNGTMYYYVVTAANPYGESIESSEVSAMPSAVSAPLPPKDVAVFGASRQTIVRWTSVDTEAGNTVHNVYWSTSPGVKRVNGNKISDVVSPYTHGGLINGNTYYYVVTSVNQYGESVESKEVSATPAQGNAPSAPTGVRAVAGYLRAVISWDTPAGAESTTGQTRYNIYWSTFAAVSSTNGTKIANVTSPYTHMDLVQDSTYYYVVTAENGYGESDDSERVSATIVDKRQDIGVALGDSITYGIGATNRTTSSYVPVLSALWGKRVIADAEDGGLSLDGVIKVDNVLQQYNPRYLLIYYGTNDAGYYNPDSVIANLQYIIERAKAYGAIPVIATLGPCFDEWAWKAPDMIDLSVRIRTLAAGQGIAVADIEIALGWNRNYMADSLHPNDTGHRIIAETFLRALTQ
jgi:lysophospholipase L1-like esterase